jgi:hypothetical protein
MPARRVWALSAFGSVAATVIAVAVVTSTGACNGNGEGQRCSTADAPGYQTNEPYNAGASDCSGDNLCWPASALGGAAASYAGAQLDPNLGICCPPPEQRSALDPVQICASQGGPFDAGAGGIPDAGSEEDTGADAASDGGEGGEGDSGEAQDALAPVDTGVPLDAPPG